ncbi:MAG: DUF2505 domain-containing protein [Actinobacteria bacterium]|nr:DUF2505 domain-containing protein [Actinomycetota bacterium]
MKFGFEQRWSAPVDDVMATYLDESFWNGIDAFTKMAPPVLLGIERDDGAGTAVVRLRYRVEADLPSQAARFIDPNDVAWVQETSWDLGARRADVRFLPVQAAGLMRAAATIEVRTDGDDTVRELRGEFKVRIPLVGAKVEKAVIGDIGTNLEEEADAVARWLHLD